MLCKGNEHLLKKPLKLIIIAAAVFTCLVIAGTVYRLFFVRFVRVPTGSMMNTILPGDHLIVGKTFGEIPRGSVVVFAYPGDSTRYVARVMGLPGETIEVRDRSVYINGAELSEEKILVKRDDAPRNKLEETSASGSGPYKVFYNDMGEEPLIDEPSGGTFGIASPFRLGDGQFFLMGDNRDNSQDSRFRGSVPRDLIWGTVSLVYYSSFRDESGQEHIRSERMFTKIR